MVSNLPTRMLFTTATPLEGDVKGAVAVPAALVIRLQRLRKPLGWMQLASAAAAKSLESDAAKAVVDDLAQLLHLRLSDFPNKGD